MNEESPTERNSRIYLTALIHSVLCLGVVKLSFEKSDGSVREMHGTLNPGYVYLLQRKPKPGHVTPLTPNPPDEKMAVERRVIKLYDLDLNEWRSFRINRLISFHLIEFTVDP